MAVKTWFATNNLASVHQEISETDPGTENFASPVTGWIVSTTNGGTAPFDAQVEQAATTFTGGPHPDGTIDTTLGDCFRTTNTYKGNFASANWTCNFCCRANTSATGQAGRARFRLFRSANANGSGAVEITSAAQIGSTVTVASTTVNSTIAFNPGAFSVNNEYIFIQVGWERTTVASMTTADVNMRIGNSASLGTRVVSADFTSTVNDLIKIDLAVSGPVQGTPTLTINTAAANALATSSFESGSPSLEATPAFAKFYIFAAANLAVNSPVFGAGAFNQKQVLAPSLLTVSSPVISSFQVIYNLVGAAKAVASPVLQSLRVVYNVAGASDETASPVIGAGVFTQKQVLSATAIAVSPPVLGAGAFAIGGLTLSAAALAVSSPVLQSVSVVYNFAGAAISVSPPVLGAVKITYNFAAANISVLPPVLQSAQFTYNEVGVGFTPASPVIGAGVFGQKHTLSAGAIAVSPPVLDVGVSGGSASLTAANIAVSSPVLGAGALTQKQVLSASALAVSSPVIGVGTFSSGAPAAQIILSPYAIDNGLNAFFAADQILMCSAVPTNYANAISLKLGGKTFGPGGTFTTPQAGSPAGRIVVSTPVTDGGIIANGAVVCWTAIDSVNSQWLASGVFAGSGAVTSGQAFALDSFAIHLT
jgi:hypothetical protein